MKCDALDLLASGSEAPDRINAWPFAWNLLFGSEEHARSAKFRACVMFALQRMGRHNYGNETKLARVLELCQIALGDDAKSLQQCNIEPPAGLMFKLACALFMLQYDRQNARLGPIDILCDAIVHSDTYSSAWSEEEFICGWAMFRGL